MNRTYYDLKFVYDKQFSHTIAQDNELELRRAIITEYEDELHVWFSWRILLKCLAYLCLGISVLLFISIPFLIASIVLFFGALFFENGYRNKLMYYNMSLAFLDLAIYNKYGIEFPENV